jgi:hypothetical protein
MDMVMHTYNPSTWLDKTGGLYAELDNIQVFVDGFEDILERRRFSFWPFMCLLLNGYTCMEK